MALLTSLSVTVIYCRKLPEPSNASLNTDKTVYDTLVTVQCNPGFKFSDVQTSKTIWCLSSGVWNDTLIDCEGL